MSKVRVISRLDVKNDYVIKGIHLEGLRKVGDPIELAQEYYRQGIDEIIFMDAVASLYGRNNLFDVIKRACKEVFIPITIGGGIRSLSDMEQALKAGADKIALNTAAIKNPIIVREASRVYGAQCIIGSIEAKKKGPNYWEAYFDNGREESGIDALEWAKRLESLGAGELLVTSIDQEGTKKGFDINLIKAISDAVSIPVIASGGAGREEHIMNLGLETSAKGIAVASLLHYGLSDVQKIKHNLSLGGIKVRL
jgi:cyclase